MSGYHNAVMPPRFSQGSTFSVAYNTRVVELESGAEHRLARFSPWGRRHYTVFRGIADRGDIREMYEFFMLREGSLNSFRFFDWFDHASNATRSTYAPNDPPITSTDMAMVHLQDRDYQVVSRYSDGVRTIVRPIEKLIPGTLLVAKNGVTTNAYTWNDETGVVSFTGADVINSAHAGFEFHVPVRFAESTDKLFAVNMQSTYETVELPGIDLVEELFPGMVSQDYQYGGAYHHEFSDGVLLLVEVNGRVQTFNPFNGDITAILPSLSGFPLGGPIFVLHNRAGSNNVIVQDSSGTVLATLAPGETTQLYASKSSASGRKWLAL